MMLSESLQGSISINLERIAKITNAALPGLVILFGVLGYFLSFFFHFLTVTFFMLAVVNLIYRHLQKHHALLANFGIIAQLRYMVESVGPEFRQYLFMSDTEEKPFNRSQRAEVYRKAKDIDSSSAFGSLLPFSSEEIKLRHTMYPISPEDISPFSLPFGDERGIENVFNLSHPVLISAMSYGALGENAVRALARGAKAAGITMNTGEGGYPKYHLMEKCDLIFQMGTAKFGVRREDGIFDPDKLEKISNLNSVKMIEIKFSQGAKPGKGGLLPKEKITDEIAELRGVPKDRDVISPPCHKECSTPGETVRFIQQVQEISRLPVGIKMCMGREDQVFELFHTMKKADAFPDYVSLDGSEGGTGAAPKTFMDDIGLPIFTALPKMMSLLSELNIQNKLKILAAGKLINPGKQFMAFSLGADAVYTARGFMLALGCIQALQCNKNTCPVGITTHEASLQHGLDIDSKARRIKNYVHNLNHEHRELLAALGVGSISDLSTEHISWKGYTP